jgi:hypothetical protein
VNSLHEKILLANAPKLSLQTNGIAQDAERNDTPSFTGAPIPFGGWKKSGLGREGSRNGPAGIHGTRIYVLRRSGRVRN